MRFRTRAFLLSFLPFAVLLGGSFWGIQKLVQSTVREGLRTSLRENQRAILRERARDEVQNGRFLRIAGENAALKAGLQLLLSSPKNEAARSTVEDQLRELCEQMGFDLLTVSDSKGGMLAGVLRGSDRQVTPVGDSVAGLPSKGLTTIDGRIYRVASVPIDQGDDNLAQLVVGETFSLAEFSTPAVLIRQGKVLRSSVPQAAAADVGRALAGCPGQRECDVQISGVSYISLPLEDAAVRDGYGLRSLQSVDAATDPVDEALRHLFLLAAAGAVLAAFVFSAGSSHSIVKPIGALISHFRQNERTGELTELDAEPSGIQEIRELTSGFNRAAASSREAKQNLQRAYIEYVGSLASALDARDQYTAGHSRRVSDLSCETAAALYVGADERDRIRIGALLHDIGKIGIADSVLQKPGKLTVEEFEIVKQHPVIGRRILEGVQGFSPYLDAVELHHENWDGSGYPHGQAGAQTPLAARVIHVVDAYDAMTSDRPYRRGMSHDQAVSILREFAGRQFDPEVVEAFAGLRHRCNEGKDGNALEAAGCRG